MLSRSTTAEVVYREIAGLLADDPAADAPLTDTASFTELGLNSLMLARLLVILEDEFQVDPFATNLSIVDVRTVGALIDAYEDAYGDLGRPEVAS